jgi:hypothetical protein
MWGVFWGGGRFGGHLRGTRSPATANPAQSSNSCSSPLWYHASPPATRPTASCPLAGAPLTEGSRVAEGQDRPPQHLVPSAAFFHPLAVMAPGFLTLWSLALRRRPSGLPSCNGPTAAHRSHNLEDCCSASPSSTWRPCPGEGAAMWCTCGLPTPPFDWLPRHRIMNAPLARPDHKRCYRQMSSQTGLRFIPAGAPQLAEIAGTRHRFDRGSLVPLQSDSTHDPDLRHHGAREQLPPKRPPCVLLNPPSGLSRTS